MTISMKLTGARKLSNRLDGLTRATQNKILRPAITAATRPIRRAAKANLGTTPGGTRELERSIDAKVKTGRSAVFGVVGPRSDKAGMRLNTFGQIVKHQPSRIAHLIEGGTLPHAIMIGRGKLTRWQHPGSTATHFMRKAWETTSGESQRVIEAKIGEGIRKHA